MTSARPLLILIPAHNEQATITQVIEAVRGEAARCRITPAIVVIDDASTDDTAFLARQAGVRVLSLPVRLGAWGALQTGMRYAVAVGIPYAVTMDADGQHEAAELPTLLHPLQAGVADIVIGACPQRVSPLRRMAWRYFRALTGLPVEDITSGFRAYNDKALRLLASAQASLLDYQDVGVLLIARRYGLRVIEVPVAMQAAPRASKVFSSWARVAAYMIQTTVLCLARVGK